MSARKSERQRDRERDERRKGACEYAADMLTRRAIMELLVCRENERIRRGIMRVERQRDQRLAAVAAGERESRGLEAKQAKQSR